MNTSFVPVEILLVNSEQHHLNNIAGKMSCMGRIKERLNVISLYLFCSIHSSFRCQCYYYDQIVEREREKSACTFIERAKISEFQWEMFNAIVLNALFEFSRGAIKLNIKMKYVRNQCLQRIYCDVDAYKWSMLCLYGILIMYKSSFGIQLLSSAIHTCL